MKTLEELFLHHLKDIYHAEKQILRAMPQMAKKVESPELRQAFDQHRDETVGQVERIEQIFEMMNKRPKAEPCEAIQGLIEEGKEILQEADKGMVLDAGLISAAQAIEHYEISRYGTMQAWAKQLGMNDAARLLGETLAEEKKTDKLLSELAETRVNAEAA